MLTILKKFDIIIIESEREERKMANVVILMIIMGLYFICSVWATIDEKIERVHFERARQRREFLKKHPNYCIDYDGSLVKKD